MNDILETVRKFKILAKCLTSTLAVLVIVFRNPSDCIANILASVNTNSASRVPYESTN